MSLSKRTREKDNGPKKPVSLLNFQFQGDVISISWDGTTTLRDFNNQLQMAVPIQSIVDTLIPKIELDNWTLFVRSINPNCKMMYPIAQTKSVKSLVISNNYELVLVDQANINCAMHIGIPNFELIPEKGKITICASLDLLQSDKWKFYQERLGLNSDGMTTFEWSSKDFEFQTLIKRGFQDKWLGVFTNWNYTYWSKPHLCGSFHHFLTLSEKYVSDHPQAYIRLIFHRDLFVSDSKFTHKKIGDPVMEQISTKEEDSDEDDDEKDPFDIVIASEVYNIFKGKTTWILNGTRAQIDAFICEYLCPKTSTSTFVKNGYAQYLISKAVL